MKFFMKNWKDDKKKLVIFSFSHNFFSNDLLIYALKACVSKILRSIVIAHIKLLHFFSTRIFISLLFLTFYYYLNLFF